MSAADLTLLQQLEPAAPLFSALGDPTRLSLLAQLASGEPRSISSLSTRSPTSRQAITKHLNVLAQAGLVRGRREGRTHLWQLQPRRLQEAQEYLDLISRQWDDALLRLQAFVEEE